MAQVCYPVLPNLGTGSCKLVMGEIKRILFVSQKKEDGTANYITQAAAAAIANWQTLFNKFNFSSDVLEKVVPTDLIFGFAVEQGDPETYDEGGDYEKLRDGDYNISFNFNSKVPDYIKKMKEMEDSSVGVYLLDDKNQVWGKKDGVNLYPVAIRNIAVQNFNVKTRETISQESVMMRVESSTDMNSLYGVEVADGDYNSDTDFYSLIDCTGTVTTPAVTGCVAAIVDDRYGEAVTGLAGTGDYLLWNFYDAVAPTVAIPLAAAGSIAESPDGTYTINEAALLTTGHTYLLKVTHPRYDIDSMTVVVP